MVNAGRILIVPKGVWSSLTSYDMLDLVTQDGVAYIARQANVGVQPKTDSQYTYWQPFGNAAEPDNETIVYNANNRYTVNLDGKTLVYDSNDGITVAIDGETIKFDEDEGYLYADVKSNLADLGDVNLTTPANGQVLTYNAVTGKWVNANPTGGMQAHLVITSEAGSVVTVTTPSGAIVTATQVTGSTTQWECDTHEYGVHTVDAILEGDDARITVMVDACKIYNIDDSHIHANITVTFPVGLTCRCQGQGENYYASSNPYTFSVHHLGEYTITATDNDSTTYTETVEITESAQSESIFCPSTEDAPTNDIQMWLMFAGILDKDYTTLSEVLADNITLATLMADHNAVDYLVRSKSWASNKGLVPVMTSNTTPSGECIASSVYSSQYDIYKAFNGDNSTNWNSATNDSYGSMYLGYMFTEPTVVKKVRLLTPVWSSGTRVSAFKLQGYNGSSWVDIGSEITGRSDGDTSYNFDNSTAYNGYRILITNGASSTISSGALAVQLLQFYAYTGNGITEDSTAMSYIGLNNYCANTLLAVSDWLTAICNSQYFESVLNVKAPRMTDNTHPSGVASDTDNSSNAYKGLGVYAEDPNYVNLENNQNAKVMYEFPSTVTIYKIYMHLRNGSSLSRSFTYKASGSTDGSTWNDMFSGITWNDSGNGDTTNTVIATNPITAKHFAGDCYIGTKDGSNKYSVRMKVQFYGRIDV